MPGCGGRMAADSQRSGPGWARSAGGAGAAEEDRGDVAGIGASAGRHIRRGGNEFCPDAPGLGLFLNGNGIRGRDARGRRILDAGFVIYFNADEEALGFTVPPEEYSKAWDVVVDTAGERADSALRAGEILSVGGRSLLVLQAYGATPTGVDCYVSASLAGAASGHPR